MLHVRIAVLVAVATACGPAPTARSPRFAGPEEPASGGSAGSNGGGGPGEAGSGGGAVGGAGGGGEGGTAVSCDLGVTTPGEDFAPCCKAEDCLGGTCFHEHTCGAPGTCTRCNNRPFPECGCDGHVVPGGCDANVAIGWGPCGYAEGEFYCGRATCRRGQLCVIDGGQSRCLPERPTSAEAAIEQVYRLVQEGKLCRGRAYGRHRGGVDSYLVCK